MVNGHSKSLIIVHTKLYKPKLYTAKIKILINLSIKMLYTLYTSRFKFVKFQAPALDVKS